jgi:hypothetical protein
MDQQLPTRRPTHEEQFLLDSRRQMIQVHDLRHARLGHMDRPSEFGLIGNLPFADQPVEVNGQRHQA